MYDCIFDQPRAIGEILSDRRAEEEQLVRIAAKARRIHISGIGTSWHAALVGEFLFRQVARRPDARAWHSFEFTAYPPPLNDDDLVIVMSHTGRKRYSRDVLELAEKSGATTALITSTVSEARVDQADVVVHTTYRDKSAAFTISHTGAMTALAMAAVGLLGQAQAGQIAQAAQAATADLARLPQLVSEALAQEKRVKEAVGRFREKSWYCFAGWGPNTATAYEAALKVNEAAYDVTTAFQIEQFLHGPFVATGPGCLVTLIAPPGAGYQRSVEVATAVRETGGHVLALVEAGDGTMSRVADIAIELPSVPEFLTPIVYLVPLQLFTYWLALDRGRNPDVFRLDDPRHQAARTHYQL
jgi:glucosamine--fructose-6-phosphate aminotransferase (isomerizing)